MVPSPSVNSGPVYDVMRLRVTGTASSVRFLMTVPSEARAETVTFSVPVAAR